MELHVPVMAGTVIENLKPEPGGVIVDGTVGSGGHAQIILEKIIPGGRLIAIDQDGEALKIAEERLGPHKKYCTFIHGNFRNLKEILNGINIDKIDGLFFDLGVSTMHFETPLRGFSIKHDGPLDMRMDKRGNLTARQVINNFSYEEIERIIREYGEEGRSRRIADAIIERRKEKRIETTAELAGIVQRAYGGRHGRYRIHPATKTFQALRIAVNDELEALKDGIKAGIEMLNAGGRIVVISFHSLEDRIVKRLFLEYRKNGVLEIITKKPLRPDISEVRENPRARSAKVRTAERV